MALITRNFNLESAARTPGTLAHAEGRNTIASGNNAHAEGNATQATADSAHSEGGSSVASGTYSHAEGLSCTASGTTAHAEGSSSTASADYSHAQNGNCTASGVYSHASGSYSKATRSMQFAHGSYHNYAATSQYTLLVMGCQTVGTTPAIMVTDTWNGTAAVFTVNLVNVLTVLAKTVVSFRIEASARRTDTQGENAAFFITGVIARDATGNARIIGTPATTSYADTNAATWTLVPSVNTTNATNNYLNLTATGTTGATITWIATVHATELITAT